MTIQKLSIILFFYHLAFTVVFHHYLMSYGGDSLAYWNFSIANYREPSGWMDYFEYGNFFMQWLNYLPSKVVGLSYAVGNLIYGMLGFVGFVELLRLGFARWGWKEGTILGNAWIVFLFLPSTHFWTGGVGKEAVLWLSTIWVIKAIMDPWKRKYWLMLGLFLAVMTRPIHGAFLLFGAVLGMAMDPTIRSSPYRSYIIIFLGAGAFVVVSILLRQTHLVEWSVDELLVFFSSQQEFLEEFGAGSYVPMQDYSWLKRTWTVLFRPLPWEAHGNWQWAAALENVFLLLVSTAALASAICDRFSVRIPRFLMVGLLLSLSMLIVYTLTLNNFGILMRMKSILIPFIGVFCWQCIVVSRKKFTFDRI